MMVTGSASELLAAGIAAARAGDRAAARALLAQCLQQDPNNEQAWLWLAGVVDRPQETIHCLEQVLVLDPGNLAAQQGLAWARQQLRPAAPPPPPPSSLRAGLAAPPKLAEPPGAPQPDTLAERLSTGQVALPHWEARGLASLRSLETVNEMVERGQKVMDQGRVDEALDIFRGAIARQPDHAEAYAQLAVAYYHQGDKRGALVEFENAIARDSSYVDAHLSLGVIYDELGETKSAVHCWERVLELDPRHQEARERLEAARQAVQASRSRCPTCGTTLTGLEPTCPQCGRAFFVRCDNCGEFAEEHDETCPRCGAPLQKLPPAPVPATREPAIPEEALGPQIACLHCGSLNPTYHTRCTICGERLGDAAAGPAGALPGARRRWRLSWLLIVLVSWIAACGMCVWGGYAGYQIVPLADLGAADPLGVAGDLVARRTQDAIWAVAGLGSGLLFLLVGLMGLRRVRSR